MRRWMRRGWEEGQRQQIAGGGVLLESVMEVTASTDDRARSQRGGRAFKTTGRFEGGRMRYFTSGFARAKSRKTREKVCAHDLHKKLWVRRNSQIAVLDGESDHGVKQGSVAFPACNCGPELPSWFNNCCLTGTPFPLAVSSPATPQALVAAANDTTPALAVKRPQF